MKRANKKVTKLERTQQKKSVLEYHQHGNGLFLFRNRSEVASLELPKTSSDGKKWVQPKETWEGDSYFFSMVPREATLVKTIIDPNKSPDPVSDPIIETLTETKDNKKKPKKKEKKMEEKLILDQPDQVTKSGKVEHKVQEDLPLNEASPQDESKEKLLTEDPLAGVTIITD